VLSREKFRKYVPLDQGIDYVEWYAGISEQVIVTEHVIACRDPKDDKFLSVAVAGKADCIMAGLAQAISERVRHSLNADRLPG
jgi:uncharacterized protein